MTKDCNFLINQYWNKFYSEANKKAEFNAKEFIDSLDLPNETNAKLIYIDKKKKEILTAIEDLGNNIYVEFYKYQDWLGQFFAKEILLNNNNDSDRAQKAFNLIHQKETINDIFIRTAKELPPFSFQDFLNEKDDTLFYDLETKPLSMTNGDAFKCRSMQTTLIFEAVLHNLSVMQKAFLKEYSTSVNKVELLKQEYAYLHNFQNIIQNYEKHEAFEYLSKLTCLKSIELTHANNDLVEKLNKTFNNELKGYNIRLSQLKSYKRGADFIDCSIPQIIALTLIKYSIWLEETLSKPDRTPFIISENIDLLFEHAYNKMKVQCQKLRQKLNEKYPAKLSETDISDIFNNEFENIRERIKKLKDYQYFKLAQDLDLSKAYFSNKCFNSNIQSQINNFVEATVLFEETVFFNNKLIESNYNKLSLLPHLKNSLGQFETLKEAAIDEEFIFELKKLADSINKDAPVQGLLTYFWIKNIEDDFSRLFDKAFNRIESTFTNTPGEAINTLLIKKLADIKLKRLNFCRKDIPLSNEMSILEELFLIQKEQVSHLGTLDSNYIKELLYPTKIKEKPKLSFGYTKSTADLLKPIIQALCVKIDFLDEEKTSQEQFIQVITSPDLEKEDIQVHLACDTAEFKYVINKLKPYFKKLIPARIGKSKLFYSSNGTLITQHNLNSANLDTLKTKHKINKIFQELTIKNI